MALKAARDTRGDVQHPDGPFTCVNSTNILTLDFCKFPQHGALLYTSSHAAQTDYIFFNSGFPALKTVTYLGFDEPLGRLDLGLTESPSVFGTHVCPYSQVGWLLQGLKAF